VTRSGHKIFRRAPVTKWGQMGSRTKSLSIGKTKKEKNLRRDQKKQKNKTRGNARIGGSVFWVKGHAVVPWRRLFARIPRQKATSEERGREK